MVFLCKQFTQSIDNVVMILARAATRVFVVETVARTSSLRTAINRPNKSYQPIQSSLFCTNKNKQNIMVDPKRVMSYEDMLKVIHQPEKVIIDVRNPDEVKSTGKIPSSINIPLGNVQDALISMSEEEFQKNYQRSKPSASDELIFYCQSGRRSSEALDKALKLGYSKSKTYLGSWNDWSSRKK